MVCPQCGAELNPGDPAGLCPRCLLGAAIGSGTPFRASVLHAAAAATREPLERDNFGPYAILSTLGEGGMGTVYLAEQSEPIRRRVALKVVKLGMDTSQVLARFNHERQSLARMEHANIARILDAGASSRGRPFFVMDYIDGEPITAYCDRHQLTTVQRLELFLPVCRAVQHAHNKGIIHRDIKPSNVLVAVEDGAPVPKVIDFGIARATDTFDTGTSLCTQFGQMVGTPEYASPEQADIVSGEISSAADVYSLGVLLYEMLIGTVPFDGSVLRKAGFAEMLRIIREEEAPSLVERLASLGRTTAEIAARRGTNASGLRKLLAGDLNRIVKRALEKSPQRRYASPSELAADIEHYLNGEPLLAGGSRRKRLVRNTLVFLASAVVLVPAAWLGKRAAGSGREPRTVSTVVLSDLTNAIGDPSFDDSFRQKIGFELQRSPDFKVLPDSRVAEVLQQMRRTPGTRLTPEIAREICERTGSAALIESSASPAGSGFAIMLRARNCATGALLDEEQALASGRGGSLDEVGKLTARLRSKSAASFAAAQKAAVPLEEATTSSLEALKSFTAARNRSYNTDSLLLLQRAIELDPDFALAYAYLALSYVDDGEQNRAADTMRQAYRLRGTVSDRENLFITYNYDREVLRNLELTREVCDSWIAKYPLDPLPHGLLSGLTTQGTAQYEKAIEEGEKAVRLDPDFTVAYENIAEANLLLGRAEEAKAAMRRGLQRRIPAKDRVATLFFSAFLNRDGGGMEQAAARTAGEFPQGDSEFFQSLVAAFEGRVQQSRQAALQAVTLARQAHLAERAALFEGASAVRDSLFGYPEESARASTAAGQVAGRDVDFPPAFALALSRKSSAAAAMVKRMEKRYPEDTCVRFSYAPAVRALLALNGGNPAKAIELLTVSKAYELAQTGVSLYVHYGALYPIYVRGLAFRQLHQPREAAAEFQRMLDHPGLLLADPIGPAARVQLARALRDAGEIAKAKAAYQAFFDLWKKADPEIPLLRQARAEFGRL